MKGEITTLVFEKDISSPSQNFRFSWRLPFRTIRPGLICQNGRNPIMT